MNVDLIFPPGWDPIQPYLSLPALKAYIERFGHTAILHDLNVEYYDHAVSPKGVAQGYTAYAARLASCPNEKESPLVAVKSDLVAEINAAKKILRTPDFFDPMRRERALRVIDLALQVQGLAYPGLEITLQWLSIHGNRFDAASISKLLADETTTPFAAWYRQSFLPRFKNVPPALVGISLINFDQLIPTLILAQSIKQSFPDTHIVLGGDTATRLSDTILQDNSIAGFIDSIICHEGESAFLSLIDRLAQDGPQANLDQIPNLKFRAPGGHVVTNQIGHPINMNQLPRPDFTGLPLQKYFAPNLVLPIESSRGCYWGKCTFCEEVGKSYRTKSAANVQLEVEGLKEKFGTAFFAFTDPCTSPKFIREFSERLTADKANVYWRTLSRAESAFDDQTAALAYDAGCRMVMIGIESGSERISALMDKGLAPSQTESALVAFSKAGVWVHTFLMMGFPTETVQEALETVGFVRNGKSFIDSVGMSEFVAPRDTPVFTQLSGMPVTITENILNPWALHFTNFEGEVLSAAEKSLVWQSFNQELKSLKTDAAEWMKLHVNHLFLQIAKLGKDSLRNENMTPGD